MTQERILIVGLGRDGTSLGLALRARFESARVAGHDSDPEARAAALRAGAVERALETLDVDPSVTIVALAVPAIDAPEAIGRVAPLLPEGAILADLAPVMLPSVARATQEGILARFVPAHPATPSPEAPPDAARFRGATVLIGSSVDSGTPGARVAALWSSLGALPAPVAPTLHDALFALTHDLPILSAAALTRTLRRTGSLTRLLAPASRAVLDESTRAASLGPSAETLAINAPKLLPALELLEREVRGLRHALAEGGPRLAALLDEAARFQEDLAR